MQVNNPKISILMPVFNGGGFIEDTLTSIKKQNFTDYEVICINDCSTDNSLSILKEYADRDARIRVYSTDKNLGTAAKSINYGLQFVLGDYLVYSSQDDLFSEDWLSSMFSRATQEDADATIPDLVFYNGNPTIIDQLLSGVNGNKTRVLSGKEAFKYSLDWTIPGNALWRTSLVKKFGFFEFGMNADEYSVRFFYLNCNKVVFSSGTFYYRQNNPDAVTKKLSLGSFDIPYTDFMLWKLSKDFNLDVKTQLKTIARSIKGLMYYAPLTLKNKYSPARSKILTLFKIYAREGVPLWIENNIDSRRSLALERLALKSYSIFMTLSIAKHFFVNCRGFFIK